MEDWLGIDQGAVPSFYGRNPDLFGVESVRSEINRVTVDPYAVGLPIGGPDLAPGYTLPEIVVTAKRNPAIGAPMEYPDALLRIAAGTYVAGSYGVPADVNSPYYGGLSPDFTVWDSGWEKLLAPAHILPATLPASIVPKLGIPDALKTAVASSSTMLLLALGAVALFLVVKK